MIVNCVTVFVEGEHLEDFIHATTINHEGSVQEPGNMRLYVLQSLENPGRFLLYEAYESEEAAKAHVDTAHYLKWRKTVADWMAKPREDSEPFIEPEPGWKKAFVYALDVRRVGGCFHLYFNARDGWLLGKERIGLAFGTGSGAEDG